MVEGSTKKRIIGIGVVGPGEADRYMRATLEEFKRLCDVVLLVTNNATQKEIDLINEYKFYYYNDPREWGKAQPDIKTTLLKKAARFKPDWVVALDMDEVFAPEVTRETLENLASGTEIAWFFTIVNLYNDENHFAHSVGIQRFWNIRYYKFAPEYGLQFQRKALHCGLAPPIAYKFGWHAPYYIKHFGLMKPEDRAKKADRYKKYDPNARFKSKVYYDDLIKELPMREFKPQELLRILRESKECQPRVTPNITL